MPFCPTPVAIPQNVPPRSVPCSTNPVLFIPHHRCEVKNSATTPAVDKSLTGMKRVGPIGQGREPRTRTRVV